MDHNQPPKLADKFLSWFCKPELLEEVQGDLYANFERTCEQDGRWKSKWRYWMQVLHFLRPFAFKNILKTNQNTMLKNHLKIALRTLNRQKIYSTINVFGLAIGLCAFWIIQNYVTFENSYENFIPNVENTYRVQLNVMRNGQQVFQSSENYAGVGQAMKDEYPEVVEFGRLYNMGYKNNVVFTHERGLDEPITFKQKRFLYADPTVLSMFNYEMLYGSRDKALEEPFAVVISEEVAKKYFGEENPIGKSLRMKDDDFNNELCKVTGVFRSSPLNTHLKFDVLVSFSTLYQRGKKDDYIVNRYKNGWGRKDYYTYVQLASGTNPINLESKLPTLVDKYKPDLRENGHEDILKMQSLKDIHLTSRLSDEAETNGSGHVVFYLAVISWFILIIAWINYINLSTAKAVNRAKEVGLRKILGSHRRQLVWQFLIESFLINALSLALGILLLIIVKPLLADMLGTSGTIYIWSQPWFWLSAVILLILGSFISGFYPALVLSSYEPILTIKGKFKNSVEGVFLRKSLVVLQFAASVALIIGTAIVFNQMDHMQSRELGFNADQIMVISHESVRDKDQKAATGNYHAFRNAVKNEPSVSGFAATMVNPGTKLRFKTGIRKMKDDQSSSVAFALNLMDYDYLDLMEMKLAAGRNFSREFRNDPDTAIIINEAGARALGFKNPEDAVGSYVVEGENWKPQIVGVLKDFHQETLQEKIQPICYILTDFGNEYYMVKLATTDIQGAMTRIEDLWHASFGDNPLDYFFLDEYFNSYYQTEKQFRSMFLFFSVMAIIVSCLGLFGLSLFNAVQRSKEIGIRKVLGASLTQIVQLLVSDVLKLVLIANVIAWPLTYFTMSSWLENYPYRTELNIMLFIGSTLLVLLVALITIGSQTLKSASSNPADVLKYE